MNGFIVPSILRKSQFNCWLGMYNLKYILTIRYQKVQISKDSGAADTIVTDCNHFYPHGNLHKVVSNDKPECFINIHLYN